MTRLVTLEQAKEHLRVDNDVDDNVIDLQIEAASAAVLEYIGDSQYLFLDTGGEVLELDTSTTAIEDVTGLRVQRTAQQATLLLLGDFYRNREPTAGDVVDPRFGYGYLPRAVVALLYPLRTPTIA